MTHNFKDCYVLEKCPGVVCKCQISVIETHRKQRNFHPVTCSTSIC